MPDLRPFRGLRYESAQFADASSILCPPYDVVSPEERARLAALDEHNAIHLELPVADATGDAYAAAARTLEAWLAQGILKRDDVPLIYVYEQRYSRPGGRSTGARSFFCRLRLEQYGPASGVRPHEHTMSGPKEDRFRLLSAVRANLSPVLLLYDDGAGGASSAALLDELTSAPPAVEAVGPAGVGQRLWIGDPARSAAAARLLSIAGARSVTMADGHHRYETALRYASALDAPADAAWVMALLYDARSGGLALLPWHRVVGGGRDGDEILEAASGLFDSCPVGDSGELIADFEEGGRAGTIGLWTRSGGSLLSIDRERSAGQLDARRAAEVRRLDVSVLSGTLRAMIGKSSEELIAEQQIGYVSDAREAVARVDAGDAVACFLLRPTPVEAVLAVAAAGAHMPAKSTYFHPKAATGLVFNPLAP